MKIKKIGIIFAIIAVLFLCVKGFIQPTNIAKRFLNVEISKYTKYGSRDVADKFNTMSRNVQSVINRDTEKYSNKPEYKNVARIYRKNYHEAKALKPIQYYNGSDRVWFKGPNTKPRVFKDVTLQMTLSRNKQSLSNPQMTIHFDKPFKANGDDFKQMLPCATDEQVDYDELDKKLSDKGFYKDEKKTVDIKMKKCNLRFYHLGDAVGVYITF